MIGRILRLVLGSGDYYCCNVLGYITRAGSALGFVTKVGLTEYLEWLRLRMCNHEAYKMLTTAMALVSKGADNVVEVARGRDRLLVSQLYVGFLRHVDAERNVIELDSSGKLRIWGAEVELEVSEPHYMRNLTYPSLDFGIALSAMLLIAEEGDQDRHVEFGLYTVKSDCNYPVLVADIDHGTAYAMVGPIEALECMSGRRAP